MSETPKKKSNALPWILGGVGALALAGGAAYVITTQNSAAEKQRQYLDGQLAEANAKAAQAQQQLQQAQAAGAMQPKAAQQQAPAPAFPAPQPKAAPQGGGLAGDIGNYLNLGAGVLNLANGIAGFGSQFGLW